MHKYAPLWRQSWPVSAAGDAALNRALCEPYGSQCHARDRGLANDEDTAIPAFGEDHVRAHGRSACSVTRTVMPNEPLARARGDALPGGRVPGVARGGPMACPTSLSPMTDSPGPGPGPGRQARPPGRMIARGLLRALASTSALVVICYLLPLDRSSTPVAVTMLVIGLVVFVALVGFQVRAIAGSPFPGIWAVEALAISVPLFLLLFAAAYVVLATISAGNFTRPLSRTDALYFAVTVFATVGFGDITARTEVARLVVTGQMVADLIIIGPGVRIIVGAVTRGRERRPVGAVPPGG